MLITDFKVEDIIVINGVKYKRVETEKCHICGGNIDFNSNETYGKDKYYFCCKECIEEYLLDDNVDEDTFRIMGRKTLIDIAKFYGIYRYDIDFNDDSGLVPITSRYPDTRIVYDIMKSPIPITNRMIKRFKEYKEAGLEV